MQIQGTKQQQQQQHFLCVRVYACAYVRVSSEIQAERGMGIMYVRPSERRRRSLGSGRGGLAFFNHVRELSCHISSLINLASSSSSSIIMVWLSFLLSLSDSSYLIPLSCDMGVPEGVCQDGDGFHGLVRILGWVRPWW
jgi:hypothetical protein